MLIYFIFAVAISACSGDVPVSPPVLCGEIPRTIYSCLGNPRIIKADKALNCDKGLNECDKMTCIFRNSGWLKDGGVDRAKVAEHLAQFGTEHPRWAAATRHAAAACLSEGLPAQGVHLNCPAYDIMLCTLASFMKNAEAGQWSTEPQCQYPRQYAAACPACPGDCIAPLVPYGSCNACLALPRSP